MWFQRDLRLFPNHVRRFRADEVTTISDREVDPRDAGLTRDDVEAIWASVVDFYRFGLQPAIALCVRRRGLVVLDRAIGHVRGNAPTDPVDAPKVLATPDSLFSLFSASKPVTAMLIHWLDDEGHLHLDDPVEEYLPAFGRHGKERVTIRHVLTHRAGIPAIPSRPDLLDLLVDWNALVEVLCDVAPVSKAGRQLAYHAVTGGFILGEVIRRVTGRELNDVLTDVVRRPLGMKNFTWGVPRERVGEVAPEVFTGPRPGWFNARLMQRSLGMGVEEAVDMANDPRFLTSVVPSGNIVTTAEEASRFFEVLLRQGEWGRVRVFDRRTVRRAVAEQTWKDFDAMFMLPVHYSMGFMLGTEHLSLFGPGTPWAFGHPGFTNVLVWADPERDVSVALLNNGNPFITPEQVVWLRVPRVIGQRVPRVRLNKWP